MNSELRMKNEELKATNSGTKNVEEASSLFANALKFAQSFKQLFSNAFAQEKSQDGSSTMGQLQVPQIRNRKSEIEKNVEEASSLFSSALKFAQSFKQLFSNAFAQEKSQDGSSTMGQLQVPQIRNLKSKIGKNVEEASSLFASTLKFAQSFKQLFDNAFAQEKSQDGSSTMRQPQFAQIRNRKSEIEKNVEEASSLFANALKFAQSFKQLFDNAFAQEKSQNGSSTMHQPQFSTIFQTLCLSALAVLIFTTNVEASEINRGVNLLKKGEAAEAISILENAQTENPALASYIYGQAFYNLEKYDEALKSFEKAMHTTDLNLQQHAAYNAGLTAYKQLESTKEDKNKEYELAKKSTDLFKTAIKLDPRDRLAKMNYERAKNKFDQLEKPQSQNQQNQDQNNDQENEDNQDQQNHENQNDQNQQNNQQDSQQNQDQQNQENEHNQENQQQQENEQNSGDQQEQENQSKQNQQQPENAQEMTEQEAQQLLDSMKQNEQEKRPQIMFGRPIRVEKDW